jgi:hypothetical protein
MKNYFLSFIFMAFLVTSCSDDDKEHSIEERSFWTQTTGDTTHVFQLYWKGFWTGDGKEYLLEHNSGDCQYYTYPIGDERAMSLAFSYGYDRDGNDIVIYERGANSDRTTWLEGYIADDKMFLRNDTLSFELQKIESYSEID